MRNKGTQESGYEIEGDYISHLPMFQRSTFSKKIINIPFFVVILHPDTAVLVWEQAKYGDRKATRQDLQHQ